jgi:hypothetical protein
MAAPPKAIRPVDPGPDANPGQRVIAGHALARVDETPITLTPLAVQFLQSLSDTLGNYGTSTDGFDIVHADTVAAFNAEAPTVDAAAQHIMDASFTPGQASSAVLDPIGQDVIAFNKGGDTIMQDLGLQIAPPAGGGTGTGTGTGGGGGGGGGGAGGGDGGGEGGPDCEAYANIGVHCAFE